MGVNWYCHYLLTESQRSTVSASGRHCRVKIGGGGVKICEGSPTGLVEAVPVQIIIIV